MTPYRVHVPGGNDFVTLYVQEDLGLRGRHPENEVKDAPEDR
jgi:hypothetical protein